MGYGIHCECEKCGYGFSAMLGCGMLYPYQYCEAIDEMKAGKYGRQGVEFFEAFPDGAIDANYIVTRCTVCGELALVPDMTMYILKEGVSVEDVEQWGVYWLGKVCYSPIDIKNPALYELFEVYDHRCAKCGSEAEVIEDFSNELRAGNIKCPSCQSTLKATSFEQWD